MIYTNDAWTIQLVQQAQDGDREAFAMLYRHYSVSVLRTAYLILGDIGYAEDVTQEVFVQVYRHLATYQSERSAFATWLHRITINRCRTIHRRRYFAWVSLERLVANQQLPTSTPLPLEHVLQTEQQQQIWRAILCLSLKLRAVVILRYYHDLNYATVAEILGCPIGTVRSRLHAAHKCLLTILKE